MDISIRLATIADAGLLAELGERTMRDTFGGGPPEDMEAFLATTYTRAILAAELRDGQQYLIAERGPVAVGFAQVQQGPAPPQVPGERPLKLARLYVDRPHIGTGVGAALMARCLEIARAGGHDVVWLTVYEHGARAIAFYERWGFTVVGEMYFEFGSERPRNLVLARSAHQPPHPAGLTFASGG
jgi:ribosomal protein S18 acetylase RimI-like enzyme